MTAKQNAVIAVNQETFEKGGAVVQFGGKRIAYIYAPGGIISFRGTEIASWGYAGADRDKSYKYTNARTVVVDKDCKTVITSFPGLPRNISPNDPRIVGNPRWREAVNTGL